MSIDFSDTAKLVVLRKKIACTPEEFEALVARMPKREDREIIKVHSYVGPIPRTQKLFGESSYSYSSLKLVPDMDIDPLVQRCIDFANEAYPDYTFNGALVNLYENCLDNVGWHSDAEDTMVKGGPIVSVTFGFARPFQIRTIPKHWGDKKKTWSVVLNSGDVAVMLGEDFQSTLQHQVPKSTRKIPSSVDVRRINVTVRPFKPSAKRARVE